MSADKCDFDKITVLKKFEAYISTKLRRDYRTLWVFPSYRDEAR